MKGFSSRNINYMRAFTHAWPQEEFVQQPVAQLPWGHHLVLLGKVVNPNHRLKYAEQALQHGWSRNILVMHIEAQTLERQGQALTTFDHLLPASQSDLARETLKDPYKFDFLDVAREAEEGEIENALGGPLTELLLELGAGFAYAGRQEHLGVRGDDFFLDLLFYHLKLRWYVVIELKAGEFKPQHLGQLNFYLTAVDEQVRLADDQPTIGLLLCKSKTKSLLNMRCVTTLSRSV